MPLNLIPDRWLNYKPIGKRIEGTRFIAFKVPLREEVVKTVKENDRLDDASLMRDIPNLGLIIDLTNTYRYYNPEVFLCAGLEHKKLKIPGHAVPERQLINRFKDYVFSFLKRNADNDKLIGVHCTHGVNRTGYLICNFMISELSINPKEAIARFDVARGHHIERENYIKALHRMNNSSAFDSSNRTSRSTSKNHDHDALPRYRNRQYSTSLVNSHQRRRRHSLDRDVRDGSLNKANSNKDRKDYVEKEKRHSTISNWRQRSRDRDLPNGKLNNAGSYNNQKDYHKQEKRLHYSPVSGWRQRGPDRTDLQYRCNNVSSNNNYKDYVEKGKRRHYSPASDLRRRSREREDRQDRCNNASSNKDQQVYDEREKRRYFSPVSDWRRRSRDRKDRPDRRNNTSSHNDHKEDDEREKRRPYSSVSDCRRRGRGKGDPQDRLNNASSKIDHKDDDEREKRMSDYIHCRAYGPSQKGK